MAAESAIILAGELAKLSLIAYFQYSRMAGLSKEEMEKMYLEEKSKFLENDPNKIPA